MSDNTPAYVTSPERVIEARSIVRGVVEELSQSHEVTGVVGLYSGGTDSAVVMDVLADLMTHVAHIDTTIGVPAALDHVRESVKQWPDLKYIEQRTPVSYDDLVLGRVNGYRGGFPGPGMHGAMYQWLKERALRRVRAQLVTNGYRQRVVFVTGVRIHESERRKINVGSGVVSRDGSVVWVSPLAFWNDDDMTAYRRDHKLSTSPVADHLHMSGECLCGAFAVPGELDEIGFFYPEVRERIERLERRVVDAVADGLDVPVRRCRWGWGGREDIPEGAAGPLCSSCDVRRRDAQLDLFSNHALTGPDQEASDA